MNRHLKNARRIKAETEGQQAAWDWLAAFPVDGMRPSQPDCPYSFWSKDENIAWRLSFDETVKAYHRRKELETAQ